ncbi:MAG: hypothetical protein JWO79_3026 [Actinomycetia bacterium]|jgi:hypothetical protein|nr:hypothetical protein [Actinomycetes bacterium]MDQ1652113.1 hypothetical protein [Cryptosporangiaceae bacterium]MDQ1659902.1 hypothetical protein [Cryptosporangiaceae bacterium]
MRTSATRSPRASGSAPVTGGAAETAANSVGTNRIRTTMDTAARLRAVLFTTRRAGQAGIAIASVLAVSGLTAVAFAAPPGAQAAATNRDSYSFPAARCLVRDPRLAQLSGITVVDGQLYAISDTGPIAVYALDRTCRVSGAAALRVPAPRDPQANHATALQLAPGPRKASDVEDLAAGPDGALWLADIGGNTVRRTAVSLYRWPLAGRSVIRYDLRYPDGPHDAETLLLQMTGQPVIITKTGTGHSTVYLAQRTLGPSTTLAKAATLDVNKLRAKDDTAAGSLEVTGGAVAPDGVHFVLRTYTAAYEWDAPDGDVVRALTTGTPRVIPLAKDRQGEGIAYGEDGKTLVTAGEGLDQPVRELQIRRAEQQVLSTTPVVGVSTLAGAGMAVLLAAAILLAGRDRRRWSKRATIYETGS